MSDVTGPTGDPIAEEYLEGAGAPAPPPASAGTEALPPRPSLWHHRDYMKLWTASTVSLLGSSVSQLAIPFIAAFVLRSSPFEVALLGAVEMTPFILFALPAGAWLDRVRRRRGVLAGGNGPPPATGLIPRWPPMWRTTRSPMPI